MSRQQFSRYKLLLRLSDEAFALADQHQVDEGVLRPVGALPAERHAEIVQQIISRGLTVRQEMALYSEQVEETVEADPVPPQTQQLVRLLRSGRSPAPDELTQLLLEQERDVHLARARLHAFRQLVDEAERYLKQ